MLVLLPECDEADVPVEAVEAVALADAATLFVALAKDLEDLTDADELADAVGLAAAEEATGDTRVFADGEVVQVGLGDAALTVPPDPAELVVVLVLGLAVGGSVGVGVPLGLRLGLALTLGLLVPLGEEAAVVLPLPLLPLLLPLLLADVAGAMVELAGVLAELAVVCVAGGVVDDEAQGLAVF